jgi:hypothetical protein
MPAGHALVQNIRRGRYELATDVPTDTGSGWPSTSSRPLPERLVASVPAPAMHTDRPTQHCPVNHLKMLKRLMYGRASPDLLRRLILLAD